jgi:putative hemolysin
MRDRFTDSLINTREIIMTISRFAASCTFAKKINWFVSNYPGYHPSSGVPGRKQALAANKNANSRDQASDNILLCKAGGGEIVEHPALWPAAMSSRDGTTICVGCAPDGSHCAKYAVRKGPKTSLRRSLMELSPSTGAVTAPKSSRSPAKTKKNLRMNSLKN